MLARHCILPIRELSPITGIHLALLYNNNCFEGSATIARFQRSLRHDNAQFHGETKFLANNHAP